MTYTLPFGLKQKPLNHYFETGVIKFSIREHLMYFKISMITKTNNSLLITGHVQSKQHLEKLLSIKHLNEIPTIEVVQQ